jgi:hypothetical protein
MQLLHEEMKRRIAAHCTLRNSGRAFSLTQYVFVSTHFSSRWNRDTELTRNQNFAVKGNQRRSLILQFRSYVTHLSISQRVLLAFYRLGAVMASRFKTSTCRGDISPCAADTERLRPI